MKQKPYTNFKLDDSVKTEQERSKTNHDALEAIRQQQMRGRVERSIPVASTVNVMTAHNFNDWINHVHNLLTQKHKS